MVCVLVMNNVTMADEEEETEADENICPPGLLLSTTKWVFGYFSDKRLINF